MGFDVFISYSSKDREAVAAIAAFLERDLLVWWDRELVSGMDYEQDIFAKLARTGAVLVVWSTNAAASPWVEKEAREALARKLVVIPVLLDTTPLPDYLQSIDGIVLRDWNRRSEERELVQLARDIRLHRSASAKPTGEAVATGLAVTGADTPMTTVAGFFLAMIFLLIHDTTLQTLAWSAALIAIPLAMAFAAEKGKARVPIAASKFARGLVAGAMVVGALSLVGAAIRTGVEYQLRSAGYRPDPSVVAKEAAERADKKRLNDEIREAQDARRAEFAKAVDLGESYASSIGQCEAWRQSTGTSFEDLVRSLLLNENVEDARTIVRIIYGAGCLEGDWQRLRNSASNNATAGAVQHAVVEVPFIAASDRWSEDLRMFLEKGEFDTARQELMTKAATDSALALHQLGILDVLGLGQGADPNRGFLLFEKAARRGHLAAEANLALCQIFGIGTYLDPSAGAERLRNAIERGLSPEASFWLLKTGANLVREHSFSELMQRLNHERSSIADVVLGVLASRGLSRPPCTMPCTDEVRLRVEALTSKGERSLARYVEAISAAARGPSAVRDAANGLPGVVGTAKPPPGLRSENVFRQEPFRPPRPLPRAR